MTARPLKVLYLNTAAQASGAEFALLRLLSGIDRAKVQPIVLFGEEGTAAELVRKAGFETHVVPLDGKVAHVRKDTLGVRALLHPGRLGMMIAYAGKVAAFVRQHGVELIHTNTVKAHIYGAVAGRLASVPVVWHIRDFVNESYFPRPTVKALRFLARHAPTHVVAVSRSVMAQLQLNGRSHRSTVVHDGLSAEELAAPSPRDGERERIGPARVGIVGRLAPWKGQHIFIEAAAQVLQRGQRAKFLIIGAPMFGEHEYEKDLRLRVEALGLAEHIEFMGFRSDVPAVLRTLDVLVHASTSADPCPNTVLEGMAEGLAVIGSDGGGVPEMIVAGETGLLAPMGDAPALASAMETLLANPDRARQMGRAGFARVRQEFTAARVARQVEEVYQNVQAQRS